MFEYCNKSVASISTTLGTFLSHKVKWVNDNGDLLTQEEINSWDRESIAERYLYEYFCPKEYDKELNAIRGITNKDKFIKEAAIKIDELIPRRYFAKYNQINKKTENPDKDCSSNDFLGKNEHKITKDLVYIYKENEKKTVFKYTPELIPMTNKQFSYLSSLVDNRGYNLINVDNISCSKAGELINYFVGKGTEPEDLFEYIVLKNKNINGNIKVYFAGKISKHNWRNELLEESRIEEDSTPYIIDNKFEYCGPYFISCDHGCYHGKNTHGRMSGDYSLCDEYSESRINTIQRCYKWIDEADIVFCWIDDLTAYGTFAEIGYASAKKKKIYIACSKEIQKESIDIWFPLLSSNVLVYEDNINKAWDNFLIWHQEERNDIQHNLYKPITSAQYSYIYSMIDDSNYTLLVDLEDVDSQTADKIIIVLDDGNKTPNEYGISSILKMKEVC